MPREQDNPFAAPQTDEVATQPLPEPDGRTPGSVIVAVVGFAFVAIITAAFFLWVLVVEREFAPILLAVAIAAASPLAAIALHRRWSWLAARYAALVATVIGVVLVALLGWLAADILLLSLGLRPPGPSGPPRSEQRMFLAYCLTAVAMVAAEAAAYLALGRPAARRHFQYVCPACGSTRVASPLGRAGKLRCRACGNAW